MNKTVSITGAAGRLAYAFIFELASGAVFGRDIVVDIKLIDLPSHNDQLIGIKMELEDSNFKNLGNVSVHNQSLEAFLDSDWCVLIGSKPRGPGMERSDLLSQNGQIFKSQGILINQACSKNTKIIVVGNPCNTNAMILNKYAPNIPSENVFALMTLDENRAKGILAKHLGVKSTDISDLIIYGNHSSSMYPDIFNAKVNGVKIDTAKIQAWIFETFIPSVQGRGAEIIAKLGKSSAASAAKSVCDFIRSIETKQTSLFSAGCISKGEYQSIPGTCFSMPCYFKDGTMKKNTSMSHTEESRQLIGKSIGEISHEAESVAEL